MVKQCYAGTIEDFEKWFDSYHENEDKVELISYKRHTGKDFLTHRQSMEVAICYGWIDTIIKRLDEDKFMRTFVKRKENAGWSNNTLSYAKQLVKEGRMRPAGLKAYKLGVKKKPIDHGLPKNPDIPDELKKALIKEKLLDKFNELAKSYRRSLIYWVMRAKMDETKNKRIGVIIEKFKKGEKVF